MSVSTVGYGDVSFNTTAGRACAVPWLLLGTLTVAHAVGVLAAYSSESHHQELVRARLSERVASGEVARLRASLNDGGVCAAGEVTEAEYIVLKLLELEELDQALLGELKLAYAALRR